MTINRVLNSSRPFEALAHVLEDKSYTAEDIKKDSLSNLLKSLKKNDCQQQFSEKDVPNVSIMLQLVQRFAENPQTVVLPLLKTFIVEMISDFLLATLYSLRVDTCETFSRLYEEILEAIKGISDSSIQAKGIVIEAFCDRLLQVVTSSTFKFTVKMETLKTINLLLEKCPVVVRETMRQSKTHIELMYKLGRSVVTAGDYELQVGMIEALFRLTHQKDRKQMSKVWFTDHVHFQAFQEVKDTDFETDCRQFLNIVNGDIAGNTCVWSYPCQYAELGHVQLHKPLDQNYSDFWVDFNTNSRRISFFCQGLEDAEESLWETVTLWEDNIKEYILESQEKSTKVTLFLDVDASELTTLGSQNLGNEVRFAFSAKYDIHSAIKTTFTKTPNFVKDSKVKVSSGAQSIQINGCINGDEDVEFSTPRLPKISVPCIPMSTPTNYVTDSQEIITSAVVVKTPVCKKEKSSNVHTPKTPNNRTKAKRVKTPLQLVSGNHPVPVLSTQTVHEAQDASFCVKASKPHEPISCYGVSVGVIHDKDAIVPSSVPEEVSCIADSQTLSQTFPVLSKPLGARGNKSANGLPNNNPGNDQPSESRAMKGVTVTPCLSTITEESVPTTVSLGSVRSSICPASGHQSQNDGTDTTTPIASVAVNDVSQKSCTYSSRTRSNRARVALVPADSETEAPEKGLNYIRKDEPQKSSQKDITSVNSKASKAVEDTRQNTGTAYLKSSIHTSQDGTAARTTRLRFKRNTKSVDHAMEQTDIKAIDLSQENGHEEEDCQGAQSRNHSEKRQTKPSEIESDSVLVTLKHDVCAPDPNSDKDTEGKKQNIKVTRHAKKQKQKKQRKSVKSKKDTHVTQRQLPQEGTIPQNSSLHSTENCINEKQLTSKIEEHANSSDDSDVQCGQVSHTDVLALLSQRCSDTADSQLVDSSCKNFNKQNKLKGTFHNVSRNYTSAKLQKQNKQEQTIVKNRNKDVLFPDPTKEVDLYEFQSDSEIPDLPSKSSKQTTSGKKEKTQRTPRKANAKAVSKCGKRSDTLFSCAGDSELVPEKKKTGKRTYKNQLSKVKHQKHSLHKPFENSQLEHERELEVNFSDFDEQELITERVTGKYNSKKGTPKIMLKMVGDTESDAVIQHVNEHSVAAKSKTLLKHTCGDFTPAKVDFTSAEGMEQQLLENASHCTTESPEVTAAHESKVLPDHEEMSRGKKVQLGKSARCGERRDVLIPCSDGKSVNTQVKKSKQVSSKLDRKMHALEKSLSIKFGFTNWCSDKPDVTTTSILEGKNWKTDAVLKKGSHQERMLSIRSPREKKSMKRKRESNDRYEFNASPAELHRPKRCRKHRSIFSETEESRSEISWLGSTCRKKEKNRRVVKTYEVKKTACISSQQLDMTAYDFDSDSEEDIPITLPKQKKSRKNEESLKTKQPKQMSSKNIQPNEQLSVVPSRGNQKTKPKDKPRKGISHNNKNSNNSFIEAISLLKTQAPAAAHISPIMTPKTPRWKQPNAPGEIEKARHERSPTDNCLKMDAVVVHHQSCDDDMPLNTEIDAANLLCRPELDTIGLSRSHNNASKRNTSSYMDATPFRSQSLCTDDSIPVPKILFPTDDLPASQSASSEYELSTDMQEVDTFERDCVLGSSSAGISTLMKSFSSEVTKNMQAKKEHMESCVKSVTQKTNKQIKSVWLDGQRKRYKSFSSYKETFQRELGILEADFENLHQAEKESMVYLKDQLHKIHLFNKAVQIRYENLQAMQDALNDDVCSWKKADIQGSRRVQDTLSKGIASFKNSILSEIQQQEIKNVRRTLQTMLTL